MQLKRSLTNNSSSLSSMGLSIFCLLSSLLLLYMTINPFMQADNRHLLQECSSSEFSSTLDMASATVQLQKDIYFLSLWHAFCIFLEIYILLKMYCNCCQSVKWQILWGANAITVHKYLPSCISITTLYGTESWNRAAGFAYLSLFSAFSRAAGSWSIRLLSPLLPEDGNNFERTCSFTVVSCDVSVSWSTTHSSFHRTFLKTGVTAETTVEREQGHKLHHLSVFSNNRLKTTKILNHVSNQSPNYLVPRNWYCNSSWSATAKCTPYYSIALLGSIQLMY